ncbi:FtsK/SpoIIIE domain-containing protein [Streptomyces lasiicapitis]|uniref:FtsK/SpoIIIE domain-containing protein n=1 Tax=Streptomyces lasiicapitis TaxID=1923961 RepID=UPI00365BB838
MNPAEIVGLAPIVVGAGLALLLILAIVKTIRYVRASPALRQSIRLAARIKRRWPRLAPMAGLSVTDRKPTVMAQLSQELSTDKTRKIEPRTLIPTIKVVPDAYGVIVTAKCLPKVSLEEFQKASRFLADAWGCVRVSVVPADKPGAVVIRAVREDPLAVKTTHIPTGLPPEHIAQWDLGLDECARPAVIDLANVPGITLAGLPGYGKTSSVNKFICDFAPSPLVQIGGLDAKATMIEESDYAAVASRLFRFVGNDLHEANDFLKDMVALRRRRAKLVRAVFGTANMWHHGPREDWPLVILFVDEAQAYLREIKARDDESRKLAALVAENARLIAELVAMGRAVGMLTIPITQKPTGDALPTAIRDVAPVALSFAQRSTDAAVAALGEDIRNWDDMNPVNLQGPAYVGVMVMSNPHGPGYIRVRTPYVSDEDAARIAAQTAPLTRDPVALLATLDGGGPNLTKTLPGQDPGDLAA